MRSRAAPPARPPSPPRAPDLLAVGEDNPTALVKPPRERQRELDRPVLVSVEHLHVVKVLVEPGTRTIERAEQDERKTARAADPQLSIAVDR